jgi:hypothetical protein
METIEITGTEELEASVKVLSAEAAAIKIEDDQGLIVADEAMARIKAMRKEIDATFDPGIQRWHAGHKAALLDKKRVEAPFVTAEGRLKPEIRRYQNLRAEERRVEELRRQLEAKKEAERRQLEEAIALEAAGDKELAEMVIAAPAQVIAIEKVEAGPKLSSSYSTSTNWSAEVFNLNALVAAVHAGTVPIDALLPAMPYLNGKARAAKKSDIGIPGVRGTQRLMDHIFPGHVDEEGVFQADSPASLPCLPQTVKGMGC